MVRKAEVIQQEFKTSRPEKISTIALRREPCLTDYQDHNPKMSPAATYTPIVRKVFIVEREMNPFWRLVSFSFPCDSWSLSEWDHPLGWSDGFVVGVQG
ncbi:hypothetical protein NPIL_502571 [Nephila pilipes]|uniref:Uncharacterized protein n=1 Tax=Nephila pilipes TaxID=299642 RepID=A0A8X6J2P7_NEPPI|nr:hypothetical protein NPIL_502571 [Nephila pilipes]